jgi:hypothetical protein
MLLEAGGTVRPESGAAMLPSAVFTAHLAGNLELVRRLHTLLTPSASTVDEGGESATN